MSGSSNAMPPEPPLTIFRWAQTWNAPNYNPERRAPQPPAERVEVGKNTTNKSFKMEDIARGILEWDINIDTIRELASILDAPYDWNAYGKEFRPMREFFPDIFPSRFNREVVLANRLVTTLFNDLSRCQNYIIAHHERVPTWYPSDFIPTFTEVGATCLQTETWSSPHPPVPDCATIGTEDRPLQVTNRPATRLPGDVKCSYKFQASWRQYTDPVNRREGVNKSRSEGTQAMKAEYEKVMAQINHYMEFPGGVGFERAAKYGYIITDEEVVLVRRAPVNVRDVPGGSYTQLYASRGFPLRRAEKGPVPRTYISGMLAVLWIHILVGCTDPKNSYVMLRPYFVE
ncbi:uncharacterized protein PHACADRAFT_185759 [Phanerochaete carnosa HHB-10118-sp]|uniref:Uncharacterized protein n=1 Tax=Phanerochaete carnosa (strain HHB-10118-sp) TaxID=650164 RepID=K5W1F5_PHACS|nr:uncharacterized protein PHACADRAFT_185759 [Phanerochaete carnosa HHB-10118-sp]EKM52935.1 hypothetical protein PHACADRAFT_185759 [Phanerochaete carnosa HHB-10118-sp]